MGKVWKTSVTELLTIFRGAVIAIIPWIEKAKIPWTDEDAYDDFDNIVESLYNNIVLATLENGVLTEYSTARYGFHYTDYSKMDFIIIKSTEHPDKRLAFVCFNSLGSPLNRVHAAILNKENVVTGFLTIDLDNLEFGFVRNAADYEEAITELNVTL